METLLQDLGYGFRMLRKNRAFTIVALLTLALGIGANTAIFSVVNGVLLNPLPYSQPEQLVSLHESKPHFDSGSISYPNFRDWRKDNRTFSALAVARSSSYSLTGLGDAWEVQAQLVSTDLFPMLGVQPAVGRLFAPGEDEVGAAPVALISAGLWERKFGSSSSVLGRGITLDGRDYTIVGVIPSSFDLRFSGFMPSDVYVPIGQMQNNLLMHRSAGLGIHGIGRLKPGVTIDQARADMAQVTRNLAAAYPQDDHGIGAKIRPLKDEMVGNVRPLLLVLLGAVGLVLLIACVNVANLLLARAAGRSHEFAVRSALGAGRGRLLRQLLVESMLLGLAGGLSGLAVAHWGTQAALKALPRALPRSASIGLDPRVLLFTLVISLLAGILFGIIPARKASQSNLHLSLNERSRGSSGSRNGVQRVFVIVEMALALVLMIGAGLMVRTLAVLWSIDPGFRTDNILTFGITLPPAMMGQPPDVVRATLHETTRRLNTTPGVESSSLFWSGAFPILTDDEQLFWIEGQPKPASENDMNWALNYVVGPEYLHVMDLRLQRGRFFSEHDDEHASRIAVVDDAFVHQYFPHEDPVGKFLNLDGGDKVEIVGVVGHVRQWGLDADLRESLQAQLYRPLMQMPDELMAQLPTGVNYVVHSSTDAHALDETIRHSLQQGNADVALYGAETMDQIIAASLSARRFSMILLAVFAALALLLACIGIYGVISYVVSQRTQEIGIRMALGARRADVMTKMIRQGITLIAIGLACGVIGALAATRALSALLFGVKPFDPVTFIGTAALLAVIALVAIGVPALRAANVEPMVALRNE